MPSTFIKDPAAELQYAIDWAGDPKDGGPWLLPGDTLATSTWTVQQGLTIVDETHTDTVATIKVSGGIEGNDYTATNHIVTAAGHIDERTIKFYVRQR